jgi:RimJ/RimL family protein N-acetyltransferase
MRILESERLIIKPVEEKDLEYLLNLRWDASIMEHLIHDPISMQNQKNWFANISRKDLVLSIFLKNDQSEPIIVGTIGLYNIDHRHQKAVSRVRIDPAYQRKGIAFESRNMVMDYGFNTLNLNKITADCFADNKAIVNLCLKLGFKEEGLFRKHYYHQGEFKDAIQFGILKEEYLALKKKRQSNS